MKKFNLILQRIFFTFAAISFSLTLFAGSSTKNTNRSYTSLSQEPKMPALKSKHGNEFWDEGLELRVTSKDEPLVVRCFNVPRYRTIGNPDPRHSLRDPLRMHIGTDAYCTQFFPKRIRSISTPISFKTLQEETHSRYYLADKKMRRVELDPGTELVVKLSDSKYQERVLFRAFFNAYSSHSNTITESYVLFERSDGSFALQRFLPESIRQADPSSTATLTVIFHAPDPVKSGFIAAKATLAALPEAKISDITASQTGMVHAAFEGKTGLEYNSAYFVPPPGTDGDRDAKLKGTSPSADEFKAPEGYVLVEASHAMRFYKAALAAGKVGSDLAAAAAVAGTAATPLVSATPAQEEPKDTASDGDSDKTGDLARAIADKTQVIEYQSPRLATIRAGEASRSDASPKVAQTVVVQASHELEPGAASVPSDMSSSADWSTHLAELKAAEVRSRSASPSTPISFSSHTPWPPLPGLSMQVVPLGPSFFVRSAAVPLPATRPITTGSAVRDTVVDRRPDHVGMQTVVAATHPAYAQTLVAGHEMPHLQTIVAGAAPLGGGHFAQTAVAAHSMPFAQPRATSSSAAAIGATVVFSPTPRPSTAGANPPRPSPLRTSDSFLAQARAPTPIRFTSAASSLPFSTPVRSAASAPIVPPTPPTPWAPRAGDAIAAAPAVLGVRTSSSSEFATPRRASISVTPGRSFFPSAPLHTPTREISPGTRNSSASSTPVYASAPSTPSYEPGRPPFFSLTTPVAQADSDEPGEDKKVLGVPEEIAFGVTEEIAFVVAEEPDAAPGPDAAPTSPAPQPPKVISSIFSVKIKEKEVLVPHLSPRLLEFATRTKLFEKHVLVDRMKQPPQTLMAKLNQYQFNADIRRNHSAPSRDDEAVHKANIYLAINQNDELECYEKVSIDDQHRWQASVLPGGVSAGEIATFIERLVDPKLSDCIDVSAIRERL
jgi:hypothetical protein